MKKIAYIAVITVATLLCTLTAVHCAAANDSGDYSFKGTITAVVAGRSTETTQGNIMKVSQKGSTYDILIENVTLYGVKNLSLSGTVYTDASHNATGFDNLKVKGIAGINVKSVTGTISDKKVDLTMHGKAVGLVKFDITYSATR